MGVFVLGIDPGRRGGMAVVEVSYDGVLPEGERFGYRAVEGCCLPYVDDKRGWLPGSGKGLPKILDVGALQSMFYRVVSGHEDAVEDGRFFIVVERQQEVYGSGFVKGSFASGFNYGLLRGALLDFFGGRMHGFFGPGWVFRSGSIFLAVPSVWKKDFGVPSGKEDARRMAISFFEGDVLFPLKKDEGIAEAALLAAWRGKILAKRL